MHRKDRRTFIARAFATAALIVAIVVAALVGTLRAQTTATAVIGTDPVGGISNSVGSGVAKIVTQYSPVALRVHADGGSDIWLPQLNDGAIQLGVHGAPTAWLSYNAIGTKIRRDSIRILRSSAALLPLGFMVRKDSDIKSIADLRGRRVAGGYRSEPIPKRASEGILATFGIGMSDVNVVPVEGGVDGVDALLEGRAEAAWFTVLAPKTPEIHSKIGVRFLPIAFTPEQLQKARELIFPGLVALKFAGNLPFAPKGIELVSYEIYLLASTHTQEDAVRTVLAALWDHDEELTKIDPTLTGFTNKTAVTENAAIPYHSAAIAFYKSKGVWTPAAEAANNALIK
jgi:hypothetical protein